MGSLNLDLVMRVPRIPRPGETVHGGHLSRYPGGKGANQAVAAARAGASVAMVGAVGNDDAGEILLDSLARANVDCDAVHRHEHVATGTALISVDGPGANTIVLAEGANGIMDPGRAARAVALLEPAVVVTQCEVPGATIRAGLNARSPGTISVLNASPLGPNTSLPLDLVDLLVVNEIEASDLLDVEVTTATAPYATKRLAADVKRGCVLTMGSFGIVAHVDGEPHQLDGHSVKVIDTTGAGDAFCGAMAAALATDHSVRTSLAWGNAAGAIAATRPGAQPSMPGRREIEQHLLRPPG